MVNTPKDLIILKIKKFFKVPEQIWKLYWMRASGKWLLYGEYKTLDGVLRVIKEDKNGCFWG